ncbi:hypothetical protein KKK_22950 [Pseudomonas putida B6-2]|nr:hypothetical protein KKK_22950 [Pseudomonas putida B6-2]
MPRTYIINKAEKNIFYFIYQASLLNPLTIQHAVKPKQINSVRAKAIRIEIPHIIPIDRCSVPISIATQHKVIRRDAVLFIIRIRWNRADSRHAREQITEERRTQNTTPTFS